MVNSLTIVQLPLPTQKNIFGLKHLYFFVAFFIYCTLQAQQTETITVMSYNLLNYRNATSFCTFSQNNPTSKENALKTVVQHAEPDILVCNEIGSSPTNADFILNNSLNVSGVNYYAKASYSNNTFSSLVNMLFYNTNKLVLKSQNVVTKDLDNNNLVRVVDFYRLYYNDPLLNYQSDTVFMVVAAAHLKAGTGLSDVNERAEAAEAVMQFIQSKWPNDNVILCGDLNIYKSQELAYQHFTNWSVAPARLYDPVNSPGNWGNNSSFAALHTQSTRLGATNGGCFSGGGLDDRLDHILISNEVRDNLLGMRYLPNTYFALGNDGLHFNKDIKDGTNNSVPATVLNALYDLSDHLPVIAEFELKRQQIGLPEFTKAYLTFENPVNDVLRFRLGEFPTSEFTLRLIDLTGKTVAQKRFFGLRNGDDDISVAHLPQGIYVVEITGKNGFKIMQKMMKK